METLARNELIERQYFFKIMISSKWCNQKIDNLTATNLMTL